VHWTNLVKIFLACFRSDPELGQVAGSRGKALGWLLGVTWLNHAHDPRTPGNLAWLGRTSRPRWPAFSRRGHVGVDIGFSRPYLKTMILALDLEGTLISSATICWPRPGLFPFLTWAWEAFERIVVFSAVPATVAGQICWDLAAEGEAPAWFADVPAFEAQAEKKDLARIGPLGRVLLVDDHAEYVLAAQKPWWVPIARFCPELGCGDPDVDDGELARVREDINFRLMGIARVF